MVISFIVHGSPRGKGRPRFSGQGKFVRVYTDAKTVRYEAGIRASARDVLGGAPPLSGAVWVRVDAYVPIPKSARKRDIWAMVQCSIRPVTKPDVDNYLKSALDAINGIVFEDDNQVVTLIGRKFYSDRPRLEITVGKIDDGLCDLSRKGQVSATGDGD